MKKEMLVPLGIGACCVLLLIIIIMLIPVWQVNRKQVQLEEQRRQEEAAYHARLDESIRKIRESPERLKWEMEYND